MFSGRAGALILELKVEVDQGQSFPDSLFWKPNYIF